jgi:primary-amine oxidase
MLKETQAADIVRSDFSSHENSLRYRVITLKEPPKKEMIAFLEEGHSGRPMTKRPSRVAMVQVLITGELHEPYKLFEILVNLSEGIIQEKQYLVSKHSYIDAGYMKEVEKACMADPRVQEEIETLDLPDGATVCVEPWAYATDGMNDMARRITMVWFPRPPYVRSVLFIVC